jgi:hypothetical protein
MIEKKPNFHYCWSDGIGIRVMRDMDWVGVKHIAMLLNVKCGSLEYQVLLSHCNNIGQTDIAKGGWIICLIIIVFKGHWSGYST